MVTLRSGARNQNADLSMSNEAKARLRKRERVRGYYNDMGGNRGNCTYGIGILAHRGPCTEQELRTPLTEAQITASFDAAIREAERAVRRNVDRQALTQDQFDALVRYAFNTGAHGARQTFQLVNRGALQAAANNISSNIRARVDGRLVIARGLIDRRREESEPFRQRGGR
ncbi:glycoside hydrolase family protein [Massilia sp. TS11]|uniref:glycoside hydrolase family protein n=1 Tax=Massilia sp. TS11 TaxID=2908003 RepID=UPI001EDB35F5|nr:glycoside hydrolase family protein [Massilia sp. TS11]MCG2586617.1 glycoside hydrolase family protein [Massilia sp. TS11]